MFYFLLPDDTFFDLVKYPRLLAVLEAKSNEGSRITCYNNYSSVFSVLLLIDRFCTIFFFVLQIFSVSIMFKRALFRSIYQRAHKPHYCIQRKSGWKNMKVKLLSFIYWLRSFSCSFQSHFNHIYSIYTYFVIFRCHIRGYVRWKRGQCNPWQRNTLCRYYFQFKIFLA